jgi:hypothetical protein
MRRIARVFAQVRFGFSMQAAISNAPSHSAKRIESSNARNASYPSAASLGYVDSPLRPKTVNGVEKSVDYHRR